jgi:hypothetical protein
MMIELLVACLAIGADDLPRPRTSADDSAALRAAWNTVADTVPIKQGTEQYQPDAKTLAWFLGLVEGRTRVAPPDWWREMVQGARAHNRHNIYLMGRVESNPYHCVGSLSFPADAVVEELGNTIVYRVGEEKLAIPEELLLRADRGEPYGAVSGSFTDKHLFVAVHREVPHAHDVACLKRATGQIVWKSQACGCVPPSIGGRGDAGRSSTWVSVIPTADDRVFVFGAVHTGFYLHGFRASDGESLVRFSSN